MEKFFICIFTVGTVLNFLLKHFLEYVDYKQRMDHGKEIPPELEGHVDAEVLNKTVDYENAKYFFWMPVSVLSLILKLVLVFIWFHQEVFVTVWNGTQNAYLTVILFEFFISLPETILFIPFSLYREFNIEKKFGFSKMTLGLWIIDGIKSFIMEFIMSGILLSAVVFILTHFNTLWWILVSCVLVGFSLIISYIYPTILAPIFNKFTPLEEGELKDRLTKLLEKTGFKSNGIFKMDASKRSSHSNAYFTGLGQNKRIVLYDTLIQQLTVDEIEAVLAHELGHYKNHHIVKKMCVSIPLIFAVSFVLSLLVRYVPLYEAFGFPAADTFKLDFKDFGHSYAALEYAGIFLTSLVFSGFGIFTGLIGNYFSRKDEFQADRFAAELCGTGATLSSALIKLNKENLSEFTPPEIYCLFYYSHPPLLERIRAVQNLK